MGKMKMGSTDPRQKTQIKTEPAAKQPIIPTVTKEVLEAIMSTHFETLKKLAEAEKQEILATMPPSCTCPPPMPQIVPKRRDSLARKHTLLLKKEVKADQKHLDLLLAKYAKETDERLKRLEIGLAMFLDEKPQEIQTVKETTIIEKAVLDKRMLLIVALSTLLNLAIVLLK